MARVKLIFVVLLFVPIFILFYQLFNNDLGPQPAEALNHHLGDMAFRYLALNLIWGSLVALQWWPGRWARFNILRRHLGVVTFIYALLHFTFYVIREGDSEVAFAQIGEKQYLIVGMFSLLILFVLAMTSNNWSQRLLRTKWKLLHRLAYLAILLVTYHYYLIEKKDWRVTLPFLVPLGFLFILRLARNVRQRFFTSR